MRELLTRYGVGVVTDPAPFLSTIIVTSAGLVAIIGGLLVARFVSLDSDQKGTRKVLDEAADRLAAAHRRAAQARSNLNAWDADGFLRGNVLDAIGEGITDLNLLRRLDDCQLTDDELSPFVADVAEEFARARAELAARPINDFLDVSGWDRFRQATHGLLEIRWPRVWRTVFEEMRGDRAEELAAARKQRAARAGPLSALAQLSQVATPDLGMLALAGKTDHGAIAARRYDDLAAADQRAQQQVEDYQAEFRRLRQAHDEVVRPDVRLWWAAAILVMFAIVGVALPMWVMSRGPDDLARVRWLFYPFAGALAALIIYITVYLVQLTRRKPAPAAATADADEKTDVMP